MKQWSINIPGDYLDSFIYMGILFLFDFDGNVKLYNFEKMLSERLKKEKNINKVHEFQAIFSKKFVKNRKAEQRNKSLEIDSDFLESFKTDMLDIGEWVTDVNVTSKYVYFSSSKGIQKRRINVFDSRDLRLGTFSKKTIDLFLDTKVYSFSSSFGRSVLCCGSEGAIYGLEQDHKFNHLKDNKSDDWIDCQWYSLEDKDILSVNSERVVTYQEMKLEKNIQQLRNRIFNIKKRLKNITSDSIKKDRLIRINEIERNFKENLYKCYNLDLEGVPKSDGMQYIKQKKLQNKALFYQLGDEIFCKKDNSNNNIVSSNGEITNWRIFPNARTHFNQLHVIYNDYMSINGFEINFSD